MEDSTRRRIGQLEGERKARGQMSVSEAEVGARSRGSEVKDQ